MRPIVLALLLLGLPIGAETRPIDRSGVRTFIEHIYAGYPRHTPWQQDEYYALFAPELQSLIRRNDTYSVEEVGPLDGDPFCQCQEDAGFAHKVVAVAAAGDKAKVVVRTSFGPPAPRREELLTYQLVRIAGQWRIDDIATNAEPSMKAWLERELAKPH